jgi:triosephosphate isomerase
MAKRIVIANWKLYMESPEEAKKFAVSLRKKARTFVGVETWLAPSYPLIPVVAGALKGSALKVGAQTVSAFETGAHTGEVSAAALKNTGTSFVIVGHSERRAMGETDATVHQQFVRVAEEKMIAVLCVGERERSADGAHFTFIEEQLRSALAGAQSYASKLVVAYEPVWAIGKTAAEALQPADLEEMVIFIKKVLADVLGNPAGLRVPVLYGGSVEPSNAAALMESGVNGFLVGHESAQIEPFMEILKACRK